MGSLSRALAVLPKRRRIRRAVPDRFGGFRWRGAAPDCRFSRRCHTRGGSRDEDQSARSLDALANWAAEGGKPTRTRQPKGELRRLPRKAHPNERGPGKPGPLFLRELEEKLAFH